MAQPSHPSLSPVTPDSAVDSSDNGIWFPRDAKANDRCRGQKRYSDGKEQSGNSPSAHPPPPPHYGDTQSNDIITSLDVHKMALHAVLVPDSHKPPPVATLEVGFGNLSIREKMRERCPDSICDEAAENAPKKIGFQDYSDDAPKELYSRTYVQPADSEHINPDPVASATVDPSPGVFPLLPEAALAGEKLWGKADGSIRLNIGDAREFSVAGFEEPWNKIVKQQEWNNSDMVDFDAILGAADPDVSKESKESRLGFAEIMDTAGPDATKDLEFKNSSASKEVSNVQDNLALVQPLTSDASVEDSAGFIDYETLPIADHWQKDSLESGEGSLHKPQETPNPSPTAQLINDSNPTLRHSFVPREMDSSKILESPSTQSGPDEPSKEISRKPSGDKVETLNSRSLQSPDTTSSSKTHDSGTDATELESGSLESGITSGLPPIPERYLEVFNSVLNEFQENIEEGSWDRTQRERRQSDMLCCNEITGEADAEVKELKNFQLILRTWRSGRPGDLRIAEPPTQSFLAEPNTNSLSSPSYSNSSEMQTTALKSPSSFGDNIMVKFPVAGFIEQQGKETEYSPSQGRTSMSKTLKTPSGDLHGSSTESLSNLDYSRRPSSTASSGVTSIFSQAMTPDEETSEEVISDAEAVDTFGARLATALEKLIDVKISSIRPPSNNINSTGERRTGRASNLAFKRVEECWDNMSFAYKIVESSEPDVKDLDQYVFVVRDRTDRTTHDTTSFIDVKSTLLQDVLRDACHDMRGVSLLEDKPSIEQNDLFYVRDALKSRHRRSIEDEDAVLVMHLGLLVGYVEETFRPIDEHLSALLEKQEITYELLWALFKPNSTVYTTCRGTDAPRCVLYNHYAKGEERDGSKFTYLETRFLSSDGKTLGEATAGIKVPCFRGAKRIEFLPAYPLHYHPNRESVTRELIECGRRFVSLIGIHHRYHEGMAFFVNKDKEIVKRPVKGRIMVDAVCFKERNADHPWPWIRKVWPRQSTSRPCDSAQSTDLEPTELEIEDFLICSPTILGFCLGSKCFFEFAVANIDNVPWSPSSFADVKIPESQKKPIWALTATYLTRDHNNSFSDLVQGKGRGINFLLYGPPGVGKTLTAETIAEHHRRPLYTVPAGQIGVDPVKVESILTNTFKIASRWKAILLLDEADVFLAQRCDNPHANALVSVFLRELEQYDGILFLTTNRVRSFDEAIISRIHLALHYKPLTKEARKAVWLYFLKQATTKQGGPHCQGVIESLAEKELNGREIRNTVLVATSMAEYEGTVVGETHLRESIAAREAFQCDFGGGAMENMQSYL